MGLIIHSKENKGFLRVEIIRPKKESDLKWKVKGLGKGWECVKL